jgi:hypothetical protein
MAVEPDDGETRAQPQPLVQGHGRIADQPDSRAHAERAAVALRRVVEAGDGGALFRRGLGETVETTVEREIAVVVDQRCQHARQRHDGIGERAAGHARVLRTIQCAELDVRRGETAQ